MLATSVSLEKQNNYIRLKNDNIRIARGELSGVKTPERNCDTKSPYTLLLLEVLRSFNQLPQNITLRRWTIETLEDFFEICLLRGHGSKIEDRSLQSEDRRIKVQDWD